MRKGKFIVIEGGEGSGKGVCIEYLEEKLSDYDIIFTREPGGTPIGERVRDILMSKKHKEMLQLAKIFLFCGSRAQHVGEKIQPALDKGQHVICDRFYPSTFAHQGEGREGLPGLVTFYTICETLNSIAKGDTEADYVIYFDVEPVVGLKRKEESSDGLCTRFDIETVEYHTRVRNLYKFQFDASCKNPDGPKWYCIETTHKDEQEVKEMVWSIVKRILNV
ncbi:dTMP kinase [Patescibacteria group bacterium AH-259-L07]|nr:dTMP kinase [Patescibacteria group bacterium AH-259-L07]